MEGQLVDVGYKFTQLHENFKRNFVNLQSRYVFNIAVFVFRCSVSQFPLSDSRPSEKNMQASTKNRLPRGKLTHYMSGSSYTGLMFPRACFDRVISIFPPLYLRVERETARSLLLTFILQQSYSILRNSYKKYSQHCIFDIET